MGHWTAAAAGHRTSLACGGGPLLPLAGAPYDLAMPRERTRIALAQVRQHLFEAAVALSWTIVGVAYLTAKATILLSPVGRAVHPFDQLWSVLYVVGGPIVLGSIIIDGWASLRWRVAGLVLLSSGLIMQGIAAATYADDDVRWLIYFIYGVACALRALSCAITAKRGG